MSQGMRWYTEAEAIHDRGASAQRDDDLRMLLAVDPREPGARREAMSWRVRRGRVGIARRLRTRVGRGAPQPADPSAL